MPRWLIAAIAGIATLVVAGVVYWWIQRGSGDGRVALASIYAVTTPPCDSFSRSGPEEEPEGPPEFCSQLDAMSLERAARVVERDRDTPDGAIRWILAAKQLGARAPVDAQRHLVEGRASRVLGILRVRDLVAEVLQEDPDADLEVKEDKITQKLQASVAPLSTCSPTTPVVAVTKDRTDIMEMTSSSNVQISVPDAAKITDPQEWDRCSDWFEHADYIGSSPQTPGKSWKGRLSEKFVLSLTKNLPLSWFHNELCVHAEATGNHEHAVWYTIHILETFKQCQGESKESWAFGEKTPSPDGILVDAGETRLTNASGSSDLDIEKRLFLEKRPGYDRPVLNHWTRVFLEIMGDEAPKVLCKCHHTP